MDVKKYTNNKYIPINELSPLGDSFVKQIQEYRKEYSEIIEIGNTFAFLVETPTLIKERYKANIRLIRSNRTTDDDSILSVAKEIVSGIKKHKFKKDELNQALKKYKENNNDLTIITKYIIDNLHILEDTQESQVEYSIPELSKSDIRFIRKYNQLNHHYSIKEYINENNNSYETGRKAMEKLAELKLYSKKKLGKKFVYSPTNKLEQIMKGGAYGN